MNKKEKLVDKFLDDLARNYAEEFKNINYQKKVSFLKSKNYIKGSYVRSHFKSMYKCSVFFGVDPLKTYRRYKNYITD